ncbi:TetR/AcrR family transcriptional regulator [Kribbella sp. DT2]|uniref:TetR/AcrR family transcriptional regulator n=1 Tax=Kribbella sp. DT2 TaxID=3393427 RepID=UPI003CEE4172
MTGLRERKKQQTHDALSQVAIDLFLARGFDQVSVADIAAAANVSKPTLFKYFATKQDLVLHRFADHAHEAARVVTASALSAPEALLAHFLDGLDRRDPVTGLNDHPGVIAYYRLVFGTPSLATHLHQFVVADQAALTEALGADLDAELQAAYLVSTQQILAHRNWHSLANGQPADARHPLAVAEATQAFTALNR